MYHKLQFIFTALLLFGVLLFQEDKPFKDSIAKKHHTISLENSKVTEIYQWTRTGIHLKGMIRLKDSSNDSRDL